MASVMSFKVQEFFLLSSRCLGISWKVTLVIQTYENCVIGWWGWKILE